MATEKDRDELEELMDETKGICQESDADFQAAKGLFLLLMEMADPEEVEQMKNMFRDLKREAVSDGLLEGE